MRLRVLLLCGALVAGCSGTPDRPARPASWTVELSTAPTLLALTPDQVYGASFGNGVGGSQVYRVARDTGRKQAQHTLAGQPNGMVLAPDGELWLVTQKLPDQPSGTGIQVLDPLTLATRRTLQVTGIPLSLAFLGDVLWVGDAQGLRRTDPADGAVLQSVRTSVAAQRLVVAGDALLVVGADGVQRVDASGEPGPVRKLPAAGSVAATGNADRAWVLYPDERAESVLTPLDPRTLEPGASASSPGRAGAAAHLAGDALWVSDPGGGRLLCLDATTGALRGSREVALTGPAVADATSVVVARAQGAAALPARCAGAD